MTRPLFTDEYEEQSFIGLFLLISIVVHALVIWLWPQWQGSTVSGVGFDQGGIVELVVLPGQSSIQPPAPPRPAAPVQDRPPRQQQAPTPQPEPEPEPVVRTVQERVQPSTPPTPTAPVQERPTPAPQPEPIPPRPVEPEPQPAPEPEPGVGEDILVSEQGQFEIAATPQPEPEQETQPEQVPASVSEPETPPVEEEHVEEAAVPETAQQGDEVVDGDPDGVPDGESEEPAAPPPSTMATRFGLGSPKAVEDVPLNATLSEVRVEIYVRPDGFVDRVEVVASSGRELVDEALIGLMERWSFEATGEAYVELWRVSFERGMQDGRTVWRPVPEFVERR